MRKQREKIFLHVSIGAPELARKLLRFSDVLKGTLFSIVTRGV
jgi:hypothetical protein